MQCSPRVHSYTSSSFAGLLVIRPATTIVLGKVQIALAGWLVGGLVACLVYCPPFSALSSLFHSNRLPVGPADNERSNSIKLCTAPLRIFNCCSSKEWTKKEPRSGLAIVSSSWERRHPLSALYYLLLCTMVLSVVNSDGDSEAVQQKDN